MRHCLCAGAVWLLVSAVAACSDVTPTAPTGTDAYVPPASSLTTSSVGKECETIDFDDFTHGDAVEEVSLAFTAGTFKASVLQLRYETPGGSPRAYNTALTGAVLAALDPTHDDIQQERDCLDCATFGVDIMLVVEDATSFAEKGDHTQGGQLIFTITEGGDLGDYEIKSWLAIDNDDEATTLEPSFRLFVDDVLVAESGRKGNATVEKVSTDPHVWTSTAIFELGREEGKLGSTGAGSGSGGIDQIEVCLTQLVGGEGCTPGFWKNNPGAWPASFETTDEFCAVFDCPVDVGLQNPHRNDVLNDKTLLDALNLGGGGVNALARHAVAALLNAASSVSFDLSVSGVIAAVDAALDGGDIEGTKDSLEELNEQDCPLAADKAKGR